MCVAYTLPPDLSADERALVERMRAEAEQEAQERAALAVRVRREIDRHLGRGRSLKVALDFASAAMPVSRDTARDIWYQRKGWAV